jgi:pyruvate/2-oxoglutarate dehydrogenase complex dihydrolipoamide acyltransferase (E2) component
VVAINEVIALVAADEAELSSLQKAQPSAAAQRELPAEATAAKAVAAAADPAAEVRIFASPLARRMAKEHQLDLAAIPGTGPGGRIVEADILKALEAPAAAPPSVAAAVAPAVPVQPVSLLTVAEEIPIQGVRKAIFKNMHNSLSAQAQLTLETEVSAMGMMAIRRFLNEIRGENEVKVSYNAILVKAVAVALRKHPMINSSVDGDVVKIWKEIHVGLAMELGGGLIVPKVRFADTKSIGDISSEIMELAEKGKNKAFGPDDMQGGTFTITNLGAWGVDHFTPIVNFPESAILGVGRMVDKPCVVDGEVKVETRLNLSLTFDHRIIDGVPAATFLKTLTQMVEEPRLML